MVFYRIYRPQKISELDSEELRNTLYSIFLKSIQSPPHAFLFSGPRGLGKTSAARIVAKVINCEKHQGKFKAKTDKDIEPCNKCLQCVSITNGTNFDVLEIDGASNRGIEEIRDLKEKINLLPTKASKKVYIIDEVHMLTTEAFNALLKTLEEPPEHAVFILCTTEFGKLPQTIVSRCFRVDFKKATGAEIARSLTRVVKEEGIKIETEVLNSIAKVSEGSFREATKTLEELTLHAGKKQISQKFFEEQYNTLGVENLILSFMSAIETKDARKGFEITEKLVKNGIDFKFFIELLLEKYHTLLIESLTNQAALSTLEIKEILELLAKAYLDTKFAVLPNLPLELVIVEWSDKARNASLETGSLPSVNTTVRATPDNENSFFNNLINEVKVQNNLLAGVLRSCFAESVINDKLEITARSKFHKEKLEEEKSMQILKNAADKLTGKKIKIFITLRG